MLFDLGPDRRQSLGELHHVLVFGAFANFAKGSVVAVLLSTPCISPGCLQVPVALRAYPDVRPSRRNRKFTNAFENGAVLNPRARNSEICKPRAAFLSADAGFHIADIDQPGRFGGLLGRERSF